MISFSFLSGFVLSSSFVSADEHATDDVSITVPVACTMSGVGMNSHTATINPGTYNSNIGTTTISAFCNDNEGFAIYAIGYTNNTDGDNTLVSTTLSTPATISTGTLTSGGSSQWAMKLATPTSPTPTYPITIQNSFDSFHMVPDDYMLVAKRTAGTDVGTNAEGSTLTTTYQAYISSTQIADTYTGKVKYVMVHPNDGDAPVKDNQVAVNFLGSFTGGATKNRVVYQNNCEADGYLGEPVIVKTSNLNNDGTQNGAYTDNERIDMQPFTFSGADKVKVVVDYGITGDTMVLSLAEGIFYGGEEPDHYEQIKSEYNISGTETYIFNSDSVTIFARSFDSPESGYDYGFYITMYPIYDTPLYVGGNYQEVMTSNILSGGEQDGAYADDEFVLETFAFTGAIMIKVVVDYGVTEDTTELDLASDYWDGNWDNWDSDWDSLPYIYSSDNSLGNSVFYIDGDTVTIFVETWDTPESGYDYGFYVRVYPIYDTEQENTSLITTPNSDVACSCARETGAYATPTSGYDFWYLSANGVAILFSSENEVLDYIEANKASLLGTEINVYASYVMQDVASWGGSIDFGQEVLAVDARDGKTYTVARLVDDANGGILWMTQNLDHDIDSTKTYTSSDTNIGTDWTPSMSTYTSNTWNNTYTGPRSYDPGDVYWDGTSSVFSSTGDSHYHVGNYYNWTAAAAMNNSSSINDSVSYSICPAGWTLPDNKDYRYLMGGYGFGGDFNGMTADGGFTVQSAPFYFTMSGAYVGTYSDVGVRGDYWTRNAYSNKNSAVTLFDSNYSSVHFQSVSRGDGRSVRCVNRNASVFYFDPEIDV